MNVWWCFLMISCSFWRSRQNLLNSPKLSCGFNSENRFELSLLKISTWILFIHPLQKKTHTHTHTCSDVQPWTTTVDLGFQEFYMQPWTHTSEFSRMNMDFLCMCVKFNYLTMDYPLALPNSIIGHFFYMHAYAICYRMAGLWQSWTSTVGVCPRLYGNFYWNCPWLKVLLNAHTHTHTHTHTTSNPKYSCIYTHFTQIY